MLAVPKHGRVPWRRSINIRGVRARPFCNNNPDALTAEPCASAFLTGRACVRASVRACVRSFVRAHVIAGHTRAVTLLTCYKL